MNSVSPIQQAPTNIVHQSAMNFIAAWNQYWFAASSTNVLSLVRIAVGVITSVQFLVYAIKCPEWFGPTGWLNESASRFLSGEGVEGTGSGYRWSILFAYDSPSLVRSLAIIGLLASVAMMVGIGSRVAPIVVWLLFVTFQHRLNSMLTMHEPLLSAMIAYLIIDSGKVLRPFAIGFADSESRTSSNIAMRLIQVHLLFWIGFSLSSMLAEPSWMSGEAIGLVGERTPGWLVIKRADSWLGQWLTHAVVASQAVAVVSWFAPKANFVRISAIVLFACLVLVILGDWMYAACIAAASISLISPSSNQVE